MAGIGHLAPRLIVHMDFNSIALRRGHVTAVQSEGVGCWVCCCAGMVPWSGW
jgi:hypothetical protein